MAAHRVFTLEEEIRKVDPDWQRDFFYSVEYDFSDLGPGGRVFKARYDRRGPYEPTEEEE